MKFSENWLREWVDPAVDSAQLCRRLTLAGLEVEAVERIGEGLDGVIVAQVSACDKHPDADKLRVCRVEVGDGVHLQVVCGAPNVRVGLKAPLATLGARLPGGMQIKPALLRGVESSGMLCSARELGLDDDAAGLMELAHDAPVGAPLAAWLGLPDHVIELKLTPNRPDCLGMRGLAFDVAALFGAPLADIRIDPVPPATTRAVTVQLDAGCDCPRYVGRVIEAVDAAAATPAWLAQRLRRAGIRPVSAIVDVTQYVMLELGQPMHAYDAARLRGSICVRAAHAGESLRLLDGNDHALDAGFLVIADAERALGVAGIMGGHDSRVTAQTRDIFLEAAHFAPAAIMGRARKLGLHTDASHRFERGVDPGLPRLAMQRATRLVLEICGGRAGPLTETVREEALPAAAAVELRRARLARVLGGSIEDAEVERILRALGMQVEAVDGGWKVLAPSRRFDIAIEEDLIEEVARIHGYERIGTHAPSGALHLQLDAESRVPLTNVRARLATRGYLEAICYSFVDRGLLEAWQMGRGALALANPLSADLAVMRNSLLPGLVDALRRNLNRQQQRVRLFESGKVFLGTSETDQVARLAAVACGAASVEGWAQARREVDFFDIKGELQSLIELGGAGRRVEFAATEHGALHPGRSANVLIDGRHAGIIGALHPRLLKRLDLDCEVMVFEVEQELLLAGCLPRVTAVSPFPSVRRDIAVLVDESVPYAAIETCVRAAVGTYLSEVIVFDRYAGTNLGLGAKSLAIGLILQDDSRTLTDEDADACVSRAVQALHDAFQARLRG